MAEETKRVPLVVVGLPKPVNEMTPEEFDAFVDEATDRVIEGLGLTFPESGNDAMPPSEPPPSR